MRYLLIGWLVFFSIGCSVTAKQPALHDFGLPASTALTHGNASVSINAPTWLWDNRIRYRLLFASPSQVRFYGLDRWIASPPEMFEQLLAFNGKAQDYALIIRLQDFEQQFDAPDRARVVLRFSVEAYSDNKQKIGMQEFYMQQSTKTPDAAGAIAGFIDLAHKANERVHDWLAGLSNHKE
ncbi:ABC-type transport auxiliary lipoprotein family protein [Methylobacter sp.]|uniref:ABC-type transport auxiliary lipoprotein family protein n=1 Tax=Methylobacter sp. TaxID=2051955 RepID=UPI002FDEC5BA